MIKRDDLINEFERMYREHWAYELGAARDSCVDCSGAFVWAYRQLCGPTITHGSNSIYRRSIGEASSVAMPGYAAFKIRAWTDTQRTNRWYGTEPGDCYHIGLVDSTGKHVLNAKGAATGFSRDPISGWTCFAPLAAVDYGEEAETMEALYQAAVTTLRDPLRLRSAPETGEVVARAPMGATVDVLVDDGDGWPLVRYGGTVGYASASYLTRITYADAVEIAPGTVSEAEGTTTLLREDGTQIRLIGCWRVVED